MNYKIYDNVLNNDIINEIILYSNNSTFSDGKVGERVNLKQKIRKDFFFKDYKLIKKVDNIVYNSLHNNILNDFSSNIMFREIWKLGYYKSDNAGFYNLHTDDSGDTKHRKISMVCALSDPDDYKGGELHFPDLNISFKLKKGSIIVFNPSLMHGVTPVTEGNRYVLISFMFNSDGKKIKEKLGKMANIKNYIPYLDNIKINYSKEDLYNDYSLAQPNGDIDYSDKHKNTLWNDSNDYYIEDNNSDTLFVLFAGMGWKDSIPTFIFHNFLKQYTTIDKLFLRDIKCRYYLDGLKFTSNDLNSTIEFIKNIITKKKYKKIIGIGCSAGGFAAILYGNIFNFNKVITFSPQTVLNNKKTEIIGDIYNAPKTCEWLFNRRKDDLNYQKSLDLKNFIDFNTQVEIHYSERANNGADKKHAEYIESKNCKIIQHKGNNHLLALQLRDSGELKTIIENNI